MRLRTLREDVQKILPESVRFFCAQMRSRFCVSAGYHVFPRLSAPSRRGTERNRIYASYAATASTIIGPAHSA